LKIEKFNVTTQDGYINTIWHVWDPVAKPLLKENGEKHVAFLQHGLIDIAGTWFFNTPSQSPAYTLANNGYDLWLGNNRGTSESQRHVNLTTADKKYWKFSFDEMGQYDLPANLEFVLQKTGVSKLTYMGHSQGTTQFWIAAILYPELMTKVEAFVGFAPVMFLGHQSSSLVTTLMMVNFDYLLEDAFNSVLVKGHSLFTGIGPYFIDKLPRTVWSFVESIVGYDKVSHMDPSRMPMMAQNDVGGTGTPNLRHWSHNLRGTRFTNKNDVEYDTSVLLSSLANTKIALFVGKNDALAQPLDFERLVGILPHQNLKYWVLEDYNHLDYMWAKDADQLVDKEMYEWLASANSHKIFE
jgi:pimeloyl-ACP methyl ester carboxylesterase